MKTKYLVKDSHGNIVRAFHDWMLAYNYKHVFGHNGWYVEKRKVLMILILALFSMSASSQSYVQQGNNFVYQSQRVNKEKEVPVKTKYTIEKDGVKYPIYITKKGSCFITRISKKTGKEYRQYLPKEITEKIKNEYIKI